MADLLSMQLNLNISLYLVALDERRRKTSLKSTGRPSLVSRRLRKPQFLDGLSEACVIEDYQHD